MKRAREDGCSVPTAGFRLEQVRRVADGQSYGGKNISLIVRLLSSAICPQLQPSLLPTLSQCHPPTPQPGCFKHKQAPVLTSCHSRSRQAGYRNQDCLD